MAKWLLRLALLALVLYGVKSGVEWIERREQERWQLQQDAARHVAEQKAGQIERTVQGGNAVRTDAIRRQLEEAGQTRTLDTAGLR
jgi:hypothetical protein